MTKPAHPASAVAALAVLAIPFLICATAGPARAAGFGIFEQGSRAMGMAGAFTAQADDPSAMFHNAAGLGFQEERDVMVGVTWIRGLEADFEGANPFPGEGVTAEQETLSEFPPHLYWVEPLGESTTFGLGVFAPFGLTTEWEDEDDFPGRFISAKASLTAIDVNPTIAFQLSPSFSLGIGGVARFATVELRQHIPAQNPFTQTVADVGTLEIESDSFDEGFGWNVGLLHRTNGFFSWGLSYRSTVEIDFGGDGELSQNPTGFPQLDAVVAATLPFGRDLPVETSIEFPDMASLGLAFQVTESVLVETDFNWTGWSTFDTLVIDFTDDALPDAERPQEWDDAINVRAGVEIATRAGNAWRFGYVFDETPQPEESVSPLLPDADRNGVTIGYGWTGDRVDVDLAVMYLDFDEATRRESFPEEGDFFGDYQNEALLVGATLTF